MRKWHCEGKKAEPREPRTKQTGGESRQPGKDRGGIGRQGPKGEADKRGAGTGARCHQSQKQQLRTCNGALQQRTQAINQTIYRAPVEDQRERERETRKRETQKP